MSNPEFRAGGEREDQEALARSTSAERAEARETFESREEVMGKTLRALAAFCGRHGVPIEQAMLDRFGQAWMGKGGYFQWTPSALAFKRITASAPTPYRREVGWNGRLADVIANGDNWDEALTNELNAMIHEATGRQWLDNSEL